MNAQDLRIGNLIQFDNDIAIVLDVHIADILAGEYYEITWEDIKSKEHGFSILSKFKGIPLSEDWLLKGGFVKGDNGYIVRINELLWLSIDSGFLELKRKREFGNINKGYAKITLPTPLKYVHQLQNAWPVLTGQELEFKL